MLRLRLAIEIVPLVNERLGDIERAHESGDPWLITQIYGEEVARAFAGVGTWYPDVDMPMRSPKRTCPGPALPDNCTRALQRHTRTAGRITSGSRARWTTAAAILTSR